MSVSQAEILGKLQTVFDDVFTDKVELAPTLTAKDVPEWDSLMHISLVISVEKFFNIRFGVGEVETTRNVGEFADLISKKLPS
jgi:acyl carrier protein